MLNSLTQADKVTALCSVDHLSLHFPAACAATQWVCYLFLLMSMSAPDTLTSLTTSWYFVVIYMSTFTIFAVTFSSGCRDISNILGCRMDISTVPVEMMHQIKTIKLQQHSMKTEKHVDTKALWDFAKLLCLYDGTALCGCPGCAILTGWKWKCNFLWIPFLCVLSSGDCFADAIHMSFTSPAELSSTPVLTLKWIHAQIEKYTNG